MQLYFIFIIAPLTIPPFPIHTHTQPSVSAVIQSDGICILIDRDQFHSDIIQLKHQINRVCVGGEYLHSIILGNQPDRRRSAHETLKLRA